MRHQKIDDDDRVWILTRGADGLSDQFDPQFLTAIGNARSAEEVAHLLIEAAGEMEIAETRLW